MIAYRVNTWSDLLLNRQIDNLVAAIKRPLLDTLPSYADNAAALAANEPKGTMYHDPTGLVRIVV